MTLQRTIVGATGLAAALSVMVMTQSVVGAIISGGPGNDAAPLNNTAPVDDPGFHRVGTVGTNGSGVYLGNGWVLTANHVNGKNVFNVDGVAHTIVAGTGQSLLNPDDTLSDLYIFRVNVGAESPLAGMGLLDIATSSPSIDNVGIFIGTGLTQANQQRTTWYVTNSEGGLVWHTTDPGNPRTVVTGFEWSDQRDKRWANARVDTVGEVLEVFGRNVHGFRTEFDAVAGYGNAAANDSGSPLFLPDGEGGWVLAGIAHSVFGFENQPAQTTMHGNQTYWSDLSVYRDQIMSIIVPEPISLLLVGAAAPLLLRRRR